MGDPHRGGQGHRLHAARDGVADIVRIVVGVRGAVRMRGELVLRFDYGHIVPGFGTTNTASMRSPVRMPRTS